MHVPTLLAQSSGLVLTSDLAVSWPVLVALVLVVLGWGEARVHVSGLREREKAREAQAVALEGRIAALEVREGRAMERVDYLAARLDRIDEKLDRLLDRKGVA